MDSLTFCPVGDRGILAVFGETLSEEMNARVAALRARIQDAGLPGVEEMIPSFTSLLICYDPLVTDYETLLASVQHLADHLSPQAEAQNRVVEIPVCYGGSYGPDLPFVAQHAGLSEEEVIRRHSAATYRIYMLGFLPGFPYLGGLDSRLFTPRLANPRSRIPAGSVGIGGEQTGIYPLDSPGGWQLIGRTPLRLFDPTRDLPYQAGDCIRFLPISPSQFEQMAGQEVHR